MYPSRRSAVVTSPLLPVRCLYLPSPSDTHIDFDLKRVCDGNALSTVPRGCDDVSDDVSVRISSARAMMSCAMAETRVVLVDMATFRCWWLFIL